MRPLILIPSYNPGWVLKKTVGDCLALSGDLAVWVVMDGCTDGSEEELDTFLEDSRFRVISYPENRGKGHALIVGAKAALDAGFTHVLTIDSDGQHPVEQIEDYLELAAQYPEAALYGKPIFDENAPAARQQGRKISNGLVALETYGWGVADVLFGMRCYPLDVFVEAMGQTRFGRRYDFDTEIAVRLSWMEVAAINVPTPVRYLTAEEGGVSHFHYLRDNLLLISTHLRMLTWFVVKLPLNLVRPRINPLRNLSVGEPGSE